MSQGQASYTPQPVGWYWTGQGYAPFWPRPYSFDPTANTASPPPQLTTEAHFRTAEPHLTQQSHTPQVVRINSDHPQSLRSITDEDKVARRRADDRRAAIKGIQSY